MDAIRDVYEQPNTHQTECSQIITCLHRRAPQAIWRSFQGPKFTFKVKFKDEIKLKKVCNIKVGMSAANNNQT